MIIYRKKTSEIRKETDEMYLEVEKIKEGVMTNEVLVAQ
jgi:hypothetical protein